MRPDWAIIKRSGLQVFLQTRFKYLETFGANVKNGTYKEKLLWLLLGYLLEEIGQLFISGHAVSNSV